MFTNAQINIARENKDVLMKFCVMKVMKCLLTNWCLFVYILYVYIKHVNMFHKKLSNEFI